jgi:predicted Zn-dependent protease
MSAYNVNVAMAGYVGPIDPTNNAIDSCAAIIQQAKDLAQQRRFSEAIELLEKIVQQNPGSKPLHHLLAQLYIETKQASQARQSILRLHELGHRDPEFSAMLGMVWFRKRQFGEAILSFREAKVLGASRESCDLVLAEALLRTGRLVEAEAILENLQGEKEVRSRVCMDLLAIRLRQKRYQDAVNFALEAMRAKPFKTTVFYLMGLALMRMGESEGSTRAFEEYAQREPRWAAPYRFLERLAREAGDDSQADEYNLKAREILENRRLLQLEKQRLAAP